MPLAMEDPGFWLHRMVLRHNGIEPLAVPVDDDGLDVAALADSGATTGAVPDRVIYVGSTSKTLAPGLRIGWMVMPPQLVGAVRLSKSLADTGSR